MDNEEAKFILRAYRPNGADAGDAKFCAALEQAKRDPELARWFERELALDKTVAGKVRAITPEANSACVRHEHGGASHVGWRWRRRSLWPLD
jgi:hypothetical protein